MKTSTRSTCGRRDRLCTGPHRQAGVTLVEFAIVSPFALLLVLGIIQLGLMFSAKQVVNAGAFLAARAGSVQNAQLDKMRDVMVKALVPFYQDTTDTDDLTRLTAALAKATADTGCNAFGSCFLAIQLLNPPPEAFDDFGVTGSLSPGHTYIPNDNLEFRSHTVVGTTSGLSIQEANALKIKVTYGYELKVPLMQTVFGAIMCSIDSGLGAFGHTAVAGTPSDDCTTFYKQGRVPIVSYATVQMQTPAWKAD
jgi:TadE-like protein